MSDVAQLYKTNSCVTCAHTGYRGRVALHEVMEITEQISRVVVRNGSLAEVRELFLFQAEGGIRDRDVTGVQTCALPISGSCDCTSTACWSRSSATATPGTPTAACRSAERGGTGSWATGGAAASTTYRSSRVR